MGIKNRILLLKNIESFGEEYYKRYLALWDKNELEQDWFKSLEFFFSHSFMRGRSDKLSNEYYYFTVEVLKRYFSIANGTDLCKAYEKLFQNKQLFDSAIITVFKERHRLRGKINSIKHKKFREEVAQKNELIRELTTSENLKLKFNGRTYEKTVHLGNEEDLMMVLDVLAFLSNNRNIYKWIKNTIKVEGTGTVYKELTKLRAIGDKIASFIIRDVILLEKDSENGDYQYAFPVDTWVQKIAWKLGCKTKNHLKVKIFLLGECKEASVSPLKFNAGLWFLGSHSLDILLHILNYREL